MEQNFTKHFPLTASDLGRIKLLSCYTNVSVQNFDCSTVHDNFWYRLVLNPNLQIIETIIKTIITSTLIELKKTQKRECIK